MLKCDLEINRVAWMCQSCGKPKRKNEGRASSLLQQSEIVCGILSPGNRDWGDSLPIIQKAVDSAVGSVFEA
jgi:hypothetical protein